MATDFDCAIRHQQDGNTLTVASGGVIDVLSGGKILAGGTQASAITALTDSTGGSADDTLAAVTPNSALTDNTGGSASTTLASISDAPTANALASLAARNAEVRTALTAVRNDLADLGAKVNALIAAVHGAGITA